MLTRKPRVGETLVAGNGRRWNVRRFGEGAYASICYIVSTEHDREESCFIWKFPEGLNEYMTIEGKDRK